MDGHLPAAKPFHSITLTHSYSNSLSLSQPAVTAPRHCCCTSFAFTCKRPPPAPPVEIRRGRFVITTTSQNNIVAYTRIRITHAHEPYTQGTHAHGLELEHRRAHQLGSTQTFPRSYGAHVSDILRYQWTSSSALFVYRLSQSLSFSDRRRSLCRSIVNAFVSVLFSFIASGRDLFARADPPRCFAATVDVVCRPLPGYDTAIRPPLVLVLVVVVVLTFQVGYARPPSARWRTDVSGSRPYRSCIDTPSKSSIESFCVVCFS